MNILIISGSLRRNGNTAQAVNLIAEQMRAQAAERGEALEIEIVALGQERIEYCRGCRVCFNVGMEKCPLREDSVAAIRAKMHAADGLLLASPVYVDDVSGVMKSWIDRLASVCHRPEFAGKCAYLLATVGSSPTSHTLRTLNLAMWTWGIHVVGQAGWKTGALLKPAEMEARYNAQAGKIARALLGAVREQRALRPTFLSLMMFRIQQLAWKRADPTTVDYQYWQDQGWLDPRTTFYLPQHANSLKVFAARLVGTVVQRFVS